jgi:hypothetical protein
MGRSRVAQSEPESTERALAAWSGSDSAAAATAAAAAAATAAATAAAAAAAAAIAAAASTIAAIRASVAFLGFSFLFCTGAEEAEKWL